MGMHWINPNLTTFRHVDAPNSLLSRHKTELSATAERRQRLWREFSLGADEKVVAVRNGDWAIGDEAFPVRMHQ
jgi:hypothetical protein